MKGGQRKKEGREAIVILQVQDGSGQNGAVSEEWALIGEWEGEAGRNEGKTLMLPAGMT